MRHLPAAVAVAVLVFAAPASASHSFPLGWGLHLENRGDGLFPVYLDSTHYPDLALRPVVDRWDFSKVDLGYLPAAKTRFIRRTCPYPKARHRIRICSWDWGPDGRRGLIGPGHWANVNFHPDQVRRHYIRGRIVMNLHYVTTDDAFRAILCQEIGHTLGLDHRPDTSGSCMGLHAPSGRPNLHDFAELRRVYRHVH